MARRSPQSKQFAIGVDYGTNSVRALVVDVEDGERSRHLRLRLPQRRRRNPHRPEGPEPRPAESRGLYRGLYSVGGRGDSGGEKAASTFSPEPWSASAWTRPARRRFPSTAGGRRWPCSRSGRGNWRRTPGFGRTTPVTPKRLRSPRRPAATATAIWPSAAAPTAASGIGRKSSIAGGPRRRSSTPPTRGSNWPTSCRRFSPAISIRTRLPRGICAAGHKAMYHEQWGGLPRKQFLRQLDPALAAVGGPLRHAAP